MMKMRENIAALSIAGSDPGCGAGIQADLKTFSALGVYGTTVITAVTCQNLRGLTAIQPIEPEIVDKQLQAVLDGFPIKAAKTGMLFSKEIIETIVGILKEHPGLPLIVDPVLTSTSGKSLLQKEAVEFLKEKLFPLTALITPNIAEAEILGELNAEIKNRNDQEKAAQKLYEKFEVPVLLKGGHLPGSACDVLCENNGTTVFVADIVNGVNNHGSGCTLSAAITAFLARGCGLRESVSEAKAYITCSLKNPLILNENTRIINHFPFPPFC
jgi:hydroxymethylpyrimidine/phosphomethylpyrimidine kinase